MGNDCGNDYDYRDNNDNNNNNSATTNSTTNSINNNSNNNNNNNNVRNIQNNLKRINSGLLNMKNNAITGTRTRGSISSSANNSTHGFGPSLGYGLSDGNLGISGNFETRSVCSDFNRPNNNFPPISTVANVYVPLFACLEDGLGHGDSSENVLCLLHSALLLKSRLLDNDDYGNNENENENGIVGGGDSLIDYEDCDQDSVQDTESIASSNQYWDEKNLGGMGLGFGISFFAAVVDAGTSWMSSSKKEKENGKGNGNGSGNGKYPTTPLSSLSLLDNPYIPTGGFLILFLFCFYFYFFFLFF